MRLVTLAITIALLMAGCAGPQTATPADEAPSTQAGPDPTPGPQPAPGPEPSEPQPSPDPNEPKDNVTNEPEVPTTVNETTPGQPYDFGSPDDKTMRPGMGIDGGAGCTVNFLFQYNWNRYFLGTAAHCTSSFDDEEKIYHYCGGANNNNGATHPGSPARMKHSHENVTLAYSSWYTMYVVDEQDQDACESNDFALVEIPPEHFDKMHPAVKHIQGPRCLHEFGSAKEYDEVWGFGDSYAWQNQEPLKPKQGSFRQAQGEFRHATIMLPLTWFGDSGSPLLDADGCAMGALNVGPVSGYVDIGRALNYMQEHEGWAPELVTWDEWTPSLLPDV